MARNSRVEKVRHKIVKIWVQLRFSRNETWRRNSPNFVKTRSVTTNRDFTVCNCDISVVSYG